MTTASVSPDTFVQVPVTVGRTLVVVCALTVGLFCPVAVVVWPAASVPVAVILA